MHTRGRPQKYIDAKVTDRTIHAHAGQTACLNYLAMIFTNHPCTRGADEALAHSLVHRNRTIHAHAGQTLAD